MFDVARAIAADGESLGDAQLAEMVARGTLRRTTAELAMLADPEGEPVIANTGSLRVAGRYFKEPNAGSRIEAPTVVWLAD